MIFPLISLTLGFILMQKNFKKKRKKKMKVLKIHMILNMSDTIETWVHSSFALLKVEKLGLRV